MTIPPNTKVLFADILLEQMERGMLRDFEGRRIGVTLGEPDADGFYTPTLTVSDDGVRLINKERMVECVQMSIDDYGYIDISSAKQATKLGHELWDNLTKQPEPPDWADFIQAVPGNWR